MEAIGSGLVLIFDGHNIRHSNIADADQGTPLSIENLVVHVLAKGKFYYLNERKFFAESPEKLAKALKIIHFNAGLLSGFFLYYNSMRILFTCLFFSILFKLTVVQNYSGPESVEYDYAQQRYLITNTGSYQIIALKNGVKTVFATLTGSGPHGIEIVGDTLYSPAYTPCHSRHSHSNMQNTHTLHHNPYIQADTNYIA